MSVDINTELANRSAYKMLLRIKQDIRKGAIDVTTALSDKTLSPRLPSNTPNVYIAKTNVTSGVTALYRLCNNKLCCFIRCSFLIPSVDFSYLNPTTLQSQTLTKEM